MPIYEYRCEQCGDFEEMQRITDPPLTRCPKCHKKVKRLISNTSFQLKGSGWYVTDYARAGNGSKKTTSDTSGTKSETKSESKSDTKSDAGGAKAESSTSGTGEKSSS
jgi:putative FmdB family regulatory protein